MRTNSRSRGCGLVLAVLTLVSSLPELARAQQTGLFPRMNVRRQRVPCDQEDPIYKVYKHQYYGYHPTCWRTFPSGWGCPSREAPNREQSFKEIPLQAGERLPSLDQPETDEMRPPPATNRPGMPALPGGARSPFEEEPGAPPGAPRGGRVGVRVVSRAGSGGQHQDTFLLTFFHRRDSICNSSEWNSTARAGT